MILLLLMCSLAHYICRTLFKALIKVRQHLPCFIHLLTQTTEHVYSNDLLSPLLSSPSSLSLLLLSSVAHGLLVNTSEATHYFSCHLYLKFLIHTEYTLLGYALPFPTTLVHHQHAYNLWSLPPVETVTTHPPCHITPPCSAFKVYQDLGLPLGIPVKEFWEMWEICRGCNHIVMGSKITSSCSYIMIHYHKGGRVSLGKRLEKGNC